LQDFASGLKRSSFSSIFNAVSSTAGRMDVNYTRFTDGMRQGSSRIRRKRL